MSQRVTMLGAGAWGSAVANLMAQNGHYVTLWTHEVDVANEINQSHTNQKYLAGAHLHPTITATTDLKQALACPTITATTDLAEALAFPTNTATACFEQAKPTVIVDWIVEAIPVLHLRSVLERVQQAAGVSAASKNWLLLSKGLEQTTNLVPSQLLDSVFCSSIPAVVLSGPSFAKDLLHKVPTAVLLAGDSVLGQKAQKLVNNRYLRTELVTDQLGTQLCGALKNVIALAAGMAHGAGFGDNTRAFVLTQGLAELSQLVQVLGGQQATVYGLAGVGDVVLTAGSVTSKNFRAGVLLGQGAGLAGVASAMPVAPEGFNTVHVVHDLMRQHQLTLPLFQLTYDCVARNAAFSDGLSQLFF